ncbi:hypothetical protein DFH09DRAFT_1019182 [Mycena vulgaris]|nr:hypothetical protein DFH09DRAFT_1019182 [Mycena vulgaris]
MYQIRPDYIPSGQKLYAATGRIPQFNGKHPAARGIRPNPCRGQHARGGEARRLLPRQSHYPEEHDRNHSGHVLLQGSPHSRRARQYACAIPASTAFAQTEGKPFLMMETNMASCGGVMGVSDVFAAALWGLDYALQMAHSNFSGAFFHTGGQHVFYNPFTSPPTAQSTSRKWSVGPIYYSALVMAEAMGPSNLIQILDLNIHGTGPFRPIYGLYENGKPVRVADDLTGASDVDVVISIAGGPTPAQVKVKYLAAKTRISLLHQQCAYARLQTFGGFFESDGCLMGVKDIKTVQCDTTAQTCTAKVPTPGFALIFLTDTVYSEADTSTLTFPTTARTQTQNTATVDPSVLATSNGHSAGLDGLGSTSKGGNKSAGRRVYVPVLLAGLGMGAALLYHRIQSLYFGAQLHSSFFASFHRIRRL